MSRTFKPPRSSQSRGTRSRKKTMSRKDNRAYRNKVQDRLIKQRKNPKPGFENVPVIDPMNPRAYTPKPNYSNEADRNNYNQNNEKASRAENRQQNRVEKHEYVHPTQRGDNQNNRTQYQNTRDDNRTNYQHQQHSSNERSEHQRDNRAQFSNNSQSQQNNQRASTPTSSAGFAEFIKKFTTDKIVNNPVKIGNEWYLPPEESPFKGLKGDPFIYGTSLGFMFGEHFLPSVSLVEMLARAKSTKSITVNEKAEWLFICGRDILKQGIIQNHSAQNLNQKDFVIIKNQQNESLGIGMIDKGGEIKNIWDLGNLIRREHGLKKQGKKREF